MLQIVESNCSNMTKQITIVPPHDWFLLIATCSCTSRKTHCSRVSRFVLISTLQFTWFTVFTGCCGLACSHFCGHAFRLRSGCVQVRSGCVQMRSGCVQVAFRCVQCVQYVSGAFWVLFYSVGWRVDINCKSEHSLSTEVSLTAANRIVLCTDFLPLPCCKPRLCSS